MKDGAPVPLNPWVPELRRSLRRRRLTALLQVRPLEYSLRRRGDKDWAQAGRGNHGGKGVRVGKPSPGAGKIGRASEHRILSSFKSPIRPRGWCPNHADSHQLAEVRVELLRKWGLSGFPSREETSPLQHCSV